MKDMVRVRWFFESSDLPSRASFRKNLLLSVAGLERGYDLDACELVYGELIQNAARYAPGPVRIEVVGNAEMDFIRIADSGPDFEPHAVMPDDVMSERGRGLALVVALAGSVVVERDELGKAVSAPLPSRFFEG